VRSLRGFLTRYRHNFSFDKCPGLKHQAVRTAGEEIAAGPVFRHTLLMDGSRRENDAEHAWHLAIMALLFDELARGRKGDLLKVVSMVLIHDIVEIYCGDAFLYDEKLRALRKKQVKKSALRVFGLLPTDQARRFLRLWKDSRRGKPLKRASPRGARPVPARTPQQQNERPRLAPRRGEARTRAREKPSHRRGHPAPLAAGAGDGGKRKDARVLQAVSTWKIINTPYPVSFAACFCYCTSVIRRIV
jgi:hypothetical protein